MRRRTAAMPAALLAAVTLLLGCSGDTTPGAGTATTAAGGATATTDPGGPPPNLPPVIEGLDPVVVLTPTAGGGERPLLAWEPVTGAARYTVVLYDAAGTAVWSSLTTDTSIHVGGPALIPAANSGPRVTADNTWVVYADDATGRLIAASGRSPISP